MSNYIRKVKYNNHPSLGNLELDFCKDGKPFNTIVFAGENGCGKTTILETLSTFLNIGSIEPFSKITYTVGDEIYSAVATQDHPDLGFHSRIKESTDEQTRIRRGISNDISGIEHDIYDIRHYGCAYSKSRSGFNTQDIKTIKTSELDKDKYEKDIRNDFTSLKQLLIDIVQQDNNQWSEICNDGQPHNKKMEFDHLSRLSRFKTAFENFFEKSITFDGIAIDDKGVYQIYFKKDGNKIPVDNLSTGEKQIVFRGAMLLKSRQIIEGGFIFIDEPELSMHPKWQQKILKFYRDIFSTDGRQIVQMFFATHSEYVIKAAVEDKENALIISLHDDCGNIKAKNMSLPTVLPSIKSSEINYHVFGVSNIEYHIDLYGFFQNKYNLDKIKDADTYIINRSDLYKPGLHYKPYLKPNSATSYKTLPTYIRNCIDHPDQRSYTDEEMHTSIELLEQLCK